MLSASTPCKGGSIAPPRIIIIRMEEASAVLSFKPSIAKVKTFDHIMELNNPMDSNDHSAILPAVIMESESKTIFAQAKTANSLEGMPLPK